MRMDTDGAYRRIRIRVEQVTLMALVFNLLLHGRCPYPHGPTSPGRPIRQPRQQLCLPAGFRRIQPAGSCPQEPRRVWRAIWGR